MTLDKAIRYAPDYCKTDDDIIYKSRNGQYLHGKRGGIYSLGRPQWSLKEFLEQHKK